MLLRVLFILWLSFLSFATQADVLRIAVSANFKHVIDTLSQQFMRNTDQKVVISVASTGALYNQIIYGAPFDIFLSADSARPQKLEDKNLILKGSRQAYAYGKLVLWDTHGKMQGLNALNTWQGKLAIANPDTAPYGLAAQQTLEKLGLWNRYKTRVVQGVNIQQAWLFVDSGNVTVGMVAASQVLGQLGQKGVIEIPAKDHSPIRQDMVILKRTESEPLAREFAAFLLSGKSQDYIAMNGYDRAGSML